VQVTLLYHESLRLVVDLRELPGAEILPADIVCRGPRKFLKAANLTFKGQGTGWGTLQVSGSLPGT